LTFATLGWAAKSGDNIESDRSYYSERPTASATGFNAAINAAKRAGLSC
jgi:hypothetical protein